MTTQQTLARLRELQHSAGENYYERIGLAAKLLADRRWLEAEHAGNEIKAAKALQDGFFHDLCGILGIFDLLRILDKFPDKADWKAKNYNLRLLYDAIRPRPAKASRKAAKMRDLVAALEARDRALAELGVLRPRLQKLEKENERLKGRVEELETLIDRFRGKKAAS